MLFKGYQRRLTRIWRLFIFFVSSTRDDTATFEGYMRGLFQSERANMLRMSEVNEVDHQSMQHMLTEGCVDWQGLADRCSGSQRSVGGTDAVLIFDEAFCQKGEASAVLPAVEWPFGESR